MTREITIYLTSEQLPEAHVMVIVEGGVAMWDEYRWIRLLLESSHRVIQWPVIWWTPLIYHDEEL